MRINVYIDGFNLYYGIKSYIAHGADYRWLNLRALCEHVFPRHEIGLIRYFTARVDGRHDPASPQRQDVYLRALATLPNLSIHYGQFLSRPTRMPLANPQPSGSKTVEVIKTEEKGSDVNIATYLLLDCFKREYEMAVVISNDSDLIEPIRIVREEFGCRVGVLNPQARYSHALKRAATFYTKLREEHLRVSQFPDRLVGVDGEILERPMVWRPPSAREADR